MDGSRSTESNGSAFQIIAVQDDNAHTDTKLCSHCGIEKPLDEFYKHKRGVKGRKSWCKECIKPVNARDYRKQTGKPMKVTSIVLPSNSIQIALEDAAYRLLKELLGL